MTFPQWIARVLAIAETRGIDVRLEYPGPGLVTFIWRCRGGLMNGIAGAGESMIGLTTPEAFTTLWQCDGFYQPAPGEQVSPGPQTLQERIDRLLVDRRGRYVPRVPAIGVWRALEALL